MIIQTVKNMFSSSKELTFEREYPAPVDAVWSAWTTPDLLRRWWAPDHAAVAECEVDPVVGGRILVVMEAGEGMGKYAGTRWPLEGEFTTVEPTQSLAYDARSWTEGEDDTIIRHTNTVTLTATPTGTRVDLRIDIHEVGPGARLATMGMGFGYKAYLENLADVLADDAHA